jgi:hypothetical protein
LRESCQTLSVLWAWLVDNDKNDMVLYPTLVASLSSLMPDSADALDKLRDLVSKDHPPEDTAAIHTHAMALVARLKALNRAANTATRVCKDKTAAARLEMDQSHLQLQNLLYEKRHLEREIDKCRQFAFVATFVVSSVCSCGTVAQYTRTCLCTLLRNSKDLPQKRPAQRRS